MDGQVEPAFPPSKKKKIVACEALDTVHRFYGALYDKLLLNEIELKFC